MPITVWPYAKTRRYVHGLDLDTKEQYRHLVSLREPDDQSFLPAGIPDNPEVAYKSQFLGWPDFLGANLRPILSFDVAQQLTAKMGFSTLTQWRNYFTGNLKNAMPIPKGLTAYPDMDYVSEFQGYNDWFRRQRSQFLGIRKAKEFVQGLPINCEKEWWEYVRGEMTDLPDLPLDIPAMPSIVYGRYWHGFDDFLNAKVDYLPYEEARFFVHSLGLKSIGQWKDYVSGERVDLPKRPERIPQYPENMYSEFKSYLDWLHPEGQKWRSFELARYYVSQFDFDNLEAFKVWAKGDRPDLPSRPEDIPKSPWRVYEDQWITSNDFLNDGKPRFRSFEEAKKYLQPLGLQTGSDWELYKKGELPGISKKPKDIPANPFEVYFDEYEGIHDFLGIFSC